MKKIFKKLLSSILFVLMFSFVFGIQANAETANKETSEVSNVVLFVQFADTEGNFMSDPARVSNIQKYYNTTFPKSLVSYINTISYGQTHVTTYMPQYDPSANTITPITLSNNRDYYATSSSGEFAAMSETLNILLSGQYNLVDNYDGNGNGDVDNITFIFEGDGGERSSVFYPKKQDYEGSQTINGKDINAVNTLNEDTLFDTASIQKYGVICHEFMHSLGYPDLYKENSSASPVGVWDLMASSSVFMQYPLAYLRSSVSGWLSIDEINPDSANKHVELVPVSNPHGHQAYIIKSPQLSSSEFFVIEYRQKGDPYSNDLDAKIPGTGLIVYRINTKIENLTNRGTTDGVYVFRPGETNVTAGTAANLYTSFYSQECGRTEIGNTDLSATISDGALVFSDGTNSGIKISNIGSAGDTISCDIEFADTSTIETWNYYGDSPQISTEDSSEISADVDLDGNMYVLHTGYNTATVTKCLATDGSKTTVGNTISDFGGNGVLRIYNGIPYVAFSNYDSPSSLRIYKLGNSGSWEQVAKVDTTTDGNIQYLSMETGADGLYVFYEDGGFPNPYEMKLGKYVEGTGWSDLYNFGLINGSSPDMSVSDGKVYISYRDDTEGMNPKPATFVYDIASGTADSLGSPGDITNVSGLRIAAKDGLLCLLVHGDNGVYVYQYLADNGWTVAGDGAMSNESSPTADICISNGCPVIQMVHQKDGVQNTQVYRYRGGAWTQEGPTIDTTIANDTELVAYNNNVYLAYLSSQADNTICPMMKWKELQVQSGDILNPGAGPTTEISLVDFMIANPPTKTEYIVGETFDATGMILQGLYSDGTTKEIAVADCNVTGFDSSTEGEKEISVSYSGYEDQFKLMIKTDPTIPVAVPSVNYCTHVQNVGWQNHVKDGEVSGTSGMSLRLEGIKIKLVDWPKEQGTIQYKTHIQNLGWENEWKSDDGMSGTQGQSKRLEAIQIKLTGEIANQYDVYYQVHAQNMGWLGWAKNGEAAGTAGYSLRLEAIKIKLVEKGGVAPGTTFNAYSHPLVQYDVHCELLGWLSQVRDGALAGTTGQSKRLEAIHISLNNPDYEGTIQYKTHIQNYGWEEGWKSDGAMSGTQGQSKRLEAIQIQLTGEMANNYDVYYRVHAQEFGWMGWAVNGEPAGTAGYSYRLEALQIVLIKKGGVAPGSTVNTYVEK